MATNKKHTVHYKRKRLGLTDYRARLKLLLSKKVRLVFRKSINNLIAGLVNYNPKGDKVLKSFNCKILRQYGWKYHLGNLPSAYLFGLIIGFEAKKLNVKEAILDIGLNESIKGSCIYAFLKGVVDSGLIVPHHKDVLPNEERIQGKHILDYYNSLSINERNKQFSEYLKKGINPSNIIKDFQEIKTKILNKYKNG
jgi:large subunit ribosomal protein L18